MEVPAAHIIDRAAETGKAIDRKKAVLIISVIITVVAVLVAADGLGENGISPAALFGLQQRGWNDCWLDFFDCWSEGVMMPLGAMLMAMMIGIEIGPDVMLDEIHNGEHSRFFSRFYRACITFVVPIVMAFVLAGQLTDFFGSRAAGYSIAGLLFAGFLCFSLIGRKKTRR